MSKATEEALGVLHGLVAESLTAQIRELIAAGEPVPPALYAQAIKLLKDNGIDQPAMSGTKIDTLKDAMPDFSSVIQFKRG